MDGLVADFIKLSKVTKTQERRINQKYKSQINLHQISTAIARFKSKRMTTVNIQTHSPRQGYKEVITL